MTNSLIEDPAEVMLNPVHEKAATLRAGGMSLRNIAEACGVNESTVKSQWFNANNDNPTPMAIRARTDYLRREGGRRAGISVASLLVDQVMLVRQAAEAEQFKAALDGNWKLIEYLRANPEAEVFDTEGETVEPEPDISLLMEGGDDDVPDV